MIPLRLKVSILLLGCATAAFAQQKVTGLDEQSVKFTVEADTAWSALLKRTHGWFGADGIYTIPLNGAEAKPAGKGDKTLFIFSDTMIGEVKDGTMQPGYKMIHNSVALLTGGKPDDKQIEFSWKKAANGEAESSFDPATPQTKKGDYYWFGDGFVNREGDGSVYIFGYRVHNVSDEAFGFREVGNTLVKLKPSEAPNFKTVKQMDSPFYLKDAQGNGVGSFGAGIYANTKSAGVKNPDGYIYVYGVRDWAKNLVLARVLPKDFETYSKWQFWDGKGWDADMGKVANITDRVSNELSVTQLADGRYAMIFQVDAMSPAIGMRLANNLTGPWGPVIKIWDCKPDLIKSTFVVYNAKAHPTLSGPNDLLISYNINSLEFINDLKIHPHLYRPRFIRLKFQ